LFCIGRIVLTSRGYDRIPSRRVLIVCRAR
jgi:hypothetical protein